MKKRKEYDFICFQYVYYGIIALKFLSSSSLYKKS